MRIIYHPNAKTLTFTTESRDDDFKLGVLSANFRRTRVYKPSEEERAIDVDVIDLIDRLCELAMMQGTVR